MSSHAAAPLCRPGGRSVPGSHRRGGREKACQEGKLPAFRGGCVGSLNRASWRHIAVVGNDGPRRSVLLTRDSAQPRPLTSTIHSATTPPAAPTSAGGPCAPRRHTNPASQLGNCLHNRLASQLAYSAHGRGGHAACSCRSLSEASLPLGIPARCGRIGHLSSISPVPPSHCRSRPTLPSAAFPR
jgi:hypothetical protein